MDAFHIVFYEAKKRGSFVALKLRCHKFCLSNLEDSAHAFHIVFYEVKRTSRCDMKIELSPTRELNFHNFGVLVLGSLFHRFWSDFGGQVGAKLAPKSTKNQSRNQSKNG